MRSDARPGRVEQVQATSRSSARPPTREGFDYNVIEAFDQYWKARQEGHRGRRVGPARRPAPRQVRARQAGERRSRTGGSCSPFRPSPARLLLGWPHRHAPRGSALARASSIFALFAQLVATCYVQATWIDLHARPSTSRRTVGVVFWADPAGDSSATPCCAAFRRQPDRPDGRSFALRRPGARGLAGLARAAALPASCRRADLLAAGALSGAHGPLHLLPDRDQHRLVRRRHPHRRLVPPDRHRRPLPRLPDLELRHPEHRADGRGRPSPSCAREPVARDHRVAKALSFGRLLGYDGSRGFVRMDRRL